MPEPNELRDLRAGFRESVSLYNIPKIGVARLSPKLIEAVDAVPRHEFVDAIRVREPAGEDRFRVVSKGDADFYPLVYRTTPLEYDLKGKGEVWSTNSQPDFILHLVDLLQIQPGQNVLEVGCGSGWLSAIMAYVASPGHVHGIDIESLLVYAAIEATSRLKIRNLSFEIASVLEKESYPRQFDRIIVTASTFAIPQPVIDALVVDGLIAVPIRHRGNAEGFYVLKKTEEGTLESLVSRQCKFVPIFGQDGDNTGTHGLPDNARHLLEGAPRRQTRQFALKHKMQVSRFMGFLSRIDYGIRMYDLSRSSDIATLTEWRHEPPNNFAIGLFDEGSGSLALWDGATVCAYGSSYAEQLSNRLLAGIDAWQAKGKLQYEFTYGLKISSLLKASPSAVSRPYTEPRASLLYEWFPK
jgi:protein-L-isoaspartate O-methyltransferase